ncbi:hypothetical protein D3C81_1909190 [compost metagenome]
MPYRSNRAAACPAFICVYPFNRLRRYSERIAWTLSRCSVSSLPSRESLWLSPLKIRRDSSEDSASPANRMAPATISVLIRILSIFRLITE